MDLGKCCHARIGRLTLTKPIIFVNGFRLRRSFHYPVRNQVLLIVMSPITNHLRWVSAATAHSGRRPSSGSLSCIRMSVCRSHCEIFASPFHIPVPKVAVFHIEVRASGLVFDAANDISRTSI